MTDPLAATLNRRALVVGGTMLAASAAVATRIPEPNRPPLTEAKFNGMVPETIGEWRFQQSSGLVLPPDDALSDRLYDNLVTRIYTNQAGRAMMLLLAYKNFQNGVLQIHRPEICYPAGGYRLSSTLPVDVPMSSGRRLPGNSFSATGSERNEQVLYWTRVGDLFPVRWRDQRWAVLRANLAGVNPDGMLARVSMVNDDMAASMPVMASFIDQLRLVASPALRQLLFGPLA